MKKIFITVIAAIVLISLILAGCAQSSTSGEITEADLANLEYQIDITPSGVAQLQNGSYSEEAAPGSASKIEVRLTQYIAYGDLNSNETEDASVILLSDGGGSGLFYYVAAVMNEDEGLKSTNSLFLGDRIEMKTISIDSGLIKVEYLDRTLEQAYTDKPTVEVTKTFEVRDGTLAMVSE